MLPEKMITHDDIIAADAEGNLVETIGAAGYSQRKALANLLSEIHNAGEIDFLANCISGQLDTISGNPFFVFQSVFCLTLPLIHCRAEAAMTASTQVCRNAGADLSASLVYEALREWFQQSSERTEEGLAVLDRDMDNQTGTVRPLLLAGAKQDAKMYTGVALQLSEQARPHIRSDALWALGRVVPEDDDHMLHRALGRLTEVVDAPQSDQDTAVAAEAALHLLHRTDGKLLDAVQSLLQTACRSPTHLIQQALAHSLQNYRSVYSEPMIDATLSALQTTNKEDIHMAQTIDSLLYQWDIDNDRDRVLRFLSNLLGRRDDAIELDALGDFLHRIQHETGEVLGWYAVSLLLTGDDRLCAVAEKLLPFNETRHGLDIDLSPFALDAPWLAYLSRKIIGFCLIKKESTAALLLSCLRATPEPDRTEIENLIYNYFLMNYLTGIECFEKAISENDPARKPIGRLSLKLKSYVDSLRNLGKCQAFKPTERERQLQCYRQADFWRNVQKQAEENSVLSLLAHKSTILYGTASIAYVYSGDGDGPHRQEIPMASHEHVAKFPRLHAIDPVSLSYTIHRFRSEPPPV